MTLTPLRAASTLLITLLLAGGCGGDGAGEGAERDTPKVETGGAGTLDGDDLLDANVTTDTQVVPFPDSMAAGH